MKKFMFLIGAIALMLSVSCLPEGGNKMSSSASCKGTWTVVNTQNQQTTYTKSDVIVDIEIPYGSKKLLDITFNGVKFVSGMPDITMKVSDIVFTETLPEENPTKRFVFEQNNVIPTVNGVPFDNYEIEIFEGYIGDDVEIELVLASSPFKATFTTKEDNNESEE